MVTDTRYVWVQRSAVVLAAFSIAALQASVPTEHVNWHFVLPRLFYVAILFSAVHDGWRGGLITAGLCSGLILSLKETDTTLHHIMESVVFCFVGTGTGVLTERLNAAYQKIQETSEAMKRAERLSAIGQLSAGLAHEIRNPLASIAGAAQILGRAQGLDEKQSRCVTIIGQECTRLDRLLTTFLNFARPRPPKMGQAALEPLLENVAALAEHRVGRRGITIERRQQGKIPSLHCDSEQLEQVLLNLLINAVEASPDGATVLLEAGADRRNVWIRVHDEGSGVAPGDIDKLFDPFFTTKENGTGLGLPVAHQIVGQMHGWLDARRNPGKGMTFSVHLPLQRKGV